MNRARWAMGLLAAVGALVAVLPAEGYNNNGFNTDWVYTVKDVGTLRGYDETTGAGTWNLPGDPTGTGTTLTFADEGGNNARLFVAKSITTPSQDVVIKEFNAAGATVNSANLSTIIGGPVGVLVSLGTIRYSSHYNTLFVSLNPDRTAGATPTAVAYEINLGLTTRIHTYLGETTYSESGASGRQISVDINTRDGTTLYMTGRQMGDATGNGLADLIAFNTAGRVVGGTTAAFNVLVRGSTYNPGDTRWDEPTCPMFRERAGSDDTIIVTMNYIAGSAAALEFWLDTVAHPVDVNGNLALRGSPISVASGTNGQLDDLSKAVWLGARNGGIHTIKSDDSTWGFELTRKWVDADSPPYSAPLAPIIVEVTPDPQAAPSGEEYVRSLGVSQGTPPITWTLINGPAGTQVNASTGQVSGWTPTLAQAGQTFDFEVNAHNDVGDDRESWQVEVVAANNGFRTDHVYVVRSPYNGGQTRIFNEIDGTTVNDFLPDQTDWESITFSGKGRGNDARMFLAKPLDLVEPFNDLTPGAEVYHWDDVLINEMNASAGVVKSVKLSTILGVAEGAVGPNVVFGNIRYSRVHDTLFLALNPDGDLASSPPLAVAYEIDLALTTRIHTYVGETVYPDAIEGHPVNVAVNARDGTLYMTSTCLGDSTGTGLGDLLAFDTSGRVVGGTTSTFSVLVDGQTYAGGDPRWSYSNTVIYRKRPGGDTVLVFMSTSNPTPALEFWLDTVAHPPVNGSLALRGTSLSVGRGHNGQQDDLGGTVWLGATRFGWHGIKLNDSTVSYETARQWFDADSAPFEACNDPRFDSEPDGDVDVEDFARFQRCITTGLETPPVPLPLECACFDWGDANHDGYPEADGNIDDHDLATFLRCASGPGVPADLACDGD